MKHKDVVDYESCYESFEAIYESLKEHDSRNVLQMNKEKNTILLKLNEQYYLNIYDNTFEAYIEYATNGHQVTHWHLDYKETYEELMRYMINPQALVDEIAVMQQQGKQQFKVCRLVLISIYIILVIIALMLRNGCR